MPTPVELAAYRLPEHEGTNLYLNEYPIGPGFTKFHTTTRGTLGNLPKVAADLGFREGPVRHSRNGAWSIYNGIDLAMPNFPEGNTRVNEAFALYVPKDEEDRATDAVLRLQRLADRPFTLEDFRRDLDIFTRYYVERPGILGFPSKVTEDMATNNIFYPSLASGAIGGYLVSSGRVEGLAAGAAIAIIICGITSTTGHHFERRASGKIPHKSQYIVGDSVVGALRAQFDHIKITGLQREVYAALHAENETLTPDQFLADIYPKISMHGELIQAGLGEIGGSREGSPSTALARMVDLGKVFLQPAV